MQDAKRFIQITIFIDNLAIKIAIRCELKMSKFLSKINL